MTYYIRQGNKFHQTDSKAIDLSDQLPVGTYVLKFNEDSGQFYFEVVDDFEIPSVLYGDIQKSADRVLNTFESRTSATGVLLNGEKGSGKTLLAKLISRDGQAQDIPTILINSPFCGPIFNTFMQTFSQKAIVLFDEFEKVYDDEKQEQVLTLFDGVYPTKKLFIVTTNDSYKLNTMLKNRPGRLYYCFEYEGLDPAFVKDYAERNLIDKTKVESVINLTSVYEKFNFDMLKAVVEEMNRYNETAQEVIRVINAKPNADRHRAFQVVGFRYAGVNIPTCFVDKDININPVTSPFILNAYSDGYDDDDAKAIATIKPEDMEVFMKVFNEYGKVDGDGDEYRFIGLNLKPEYLTKIDGLNGDYEYTIPEFGATVQLREVKEKVYDYTHLL